MDDHAAFQNDLAPHALGALDATDRARLEVHLAGCAECSAQLSEYRGVVGLVPHALAIEAPSDRVRAALLFRVRALTPAVRRPALDRATSRSRSTWRPRIGWVAAAMLVASLLAWNVALQRSVTDTDPNVDVGGVARLSAGAIVELVGTGAPAASARVMIDADGRRAALVVTGLRPLPQDRVYQLWFARAGETPVTGGPFRVNPRGEAAVVLAAPVPLTQARAIAITEEPAPRSFAPTGPHLLDLRAAR